MTPLSKPDRYGRIIRRYFAWCFECNRGFEVIQFAKNGRWLIHKYQPYTIVGHTYHSKATGEWTILNELPEPAPVVVGPGGDYDKQIELNKECFKLLESLQKALKSTTALLEYLLGQMKITQIKK